MNCAWIVCKHVAEGDGGVGRHELHARVHANLPGPQGAAVHQLLADLHPAGAHPTEDLGVGEAGLWGEFARARGSPRDTVLSNLGFRVIKRCPQVCIPLVDVCVNAYKVPKNDSSDDGCCTPCIIATPRISLIRLRH